MKHSGVKYPMYLVEEFKDKMHLNLPLRSLEQAISNIQVKILPMTAKLVSFAPIVSTKREIDRHCAYL